MDCRSYFTDLVIGFIEVIFVFIKEKMFDFIKSVLSE